MLKIKEMVELLRPMKDGAVIDLYLGGGSKWVNIRPLLAAKYVLQQRGYQVPPINQPWFREDELYDPYP